MSHDAVCRYHYRGISKAWLTTVMVWLFFREGMAKNPCKCGSWDGIYNYKKEIDQNLIYITEKYLFDAALRNVAVIISRKGFSKAAKFAAEGCLKEHGKLILNVTDEDLIKMLELKSDKAADYLLDKLEEFLMGISK